MCLRRVPGIQNALHYVCTLCVHTVKATWFSSTASYLLFSEKFDVNSKNSFTSVS